MSWTTSPRLQAFRTAQPSKGMMQLRQTVAVKAAGPFFGPEEEFDCPDEEECEIDWDAMPGFADDDDDEEDQTIEDSLSYGSLAFASLEKERVKYEMSWQMEECQEDQDLCEDFCEDCVGRGKIPCRFCRGTAFVVFGDEFRKCLICSEGKEACSSCRGTGHIAPWATTMNQYLNGSMTV